MGIHAQMSSKVSLKVGSEDTAIAHKSGDVDVVATPRLIALCEEACCLAILGELAEGQTSVGLRVQFDHLAPVKQGTTVTAEATVQKIEGKRIIFSVSVTTPMQIIGAGVITRVLVNKKEFLNKAH
jgi:fluoroacetyl-CoA thioesterase